MSARLQSGPFALVMIQRVNASPSQQSRRGMQRRHQPSRLMKGQSRMRFDGRATQERKRASRILVSCCALAWAGQLSAEPFVYTGRDLLLGFRQPDSISEMVVNLGQASNYFNAPSGSPIVIGQFTPAQLQAAFSTFNGLLWSVSGTTRIGDQGDPSIPDSTLWMTRPRSDPNTQTQPWLSKSLFSQGGGANKVNELGVNTTLLSDGTPADPVSNTATVIIEPAGESRSYGLVIGDQ